MKSFFGLLLLSAMLAVLVSGRRSHRAFCKLEISNVAGGETLICLEEILDPALSILINALAEQNLTTGSIMCITRQINDGFYYRVQYDRNRLIEISLTLSGDVRIARRGYI